MGYSMILTLELKGVLSYKQNKVCNKIKTIRRENFIVIGGTTEFFTKKKIRRILRHSI
jgi:hypothetical protein